MKKSLLFISFLAVSMFMVSCGGENTKENAENTQNEEKSSAPQGMVVISLESYGLPLSLAVPDTAQNPLDITVQEWGATEVRSGKYFQMQIAEGGDLSLRKSDINEDLLYKAEVLEEGPDYIIYKQYIEGSNVEPFYHFYMVKNINGVDYEIQDINTGEAFPEKAIRKMFESAKNLK